MSIGVRTRILCLGNELMGDDGIGVRAGRVLSELLLPSEVTVEFRPHLTLDLLDIIQANQRVILLDAMSTGKPAGTCVVLSGVQLENWFSKPVFGHTLSVSEVMALAKRLYSGQKLASVYFVGIEGQWFDRFGTELCPEVRAALPAAVEAVLRILDAEEALFKRARFESERASRLDPSISEILSKPFSL